LIFITKMEGTTRVQWSSNIIHTILKNVILLGEVTYWVSSDLIIQIVCRSIETSTRF